jgi:hypothetical protein
VQAQNAVPTHVWKADRVGNFNTAANWDTFTVLPLTITLSNALTKGTVTTTTLTITGTNPLPAVQVGDLITGGTFPAGTTVSAFDDLAKTVTYATLATAPGSGTYYFSRPIASSVPGSGPFHTAQITSGTCTITANPIGTIRGLFVGNTTTSNQGKVIINPGITLALSATSPNIHLSTDKI